MNQTYECEITNLFEKAFRHIFSKKLGKLNTFKDRKTNDFYCKAIRSLFANVINGFLSSEK